MKKNNIKLLMVTFYTLLSLFVKAQSLEKNINEALKNNPKIKNFEFKYKRTSEKINEVNSLPNTKFEFGYFISEPETRTGPQNFKVSIKQMMPWFGTLKARKNYIQSLADTKYEDIIIAKKKLITLVTQSYYKLYTNKEKQKIYSENIKLLKTYEKLAITSIEVGKTSVVDVLRLQIRENTLKQLKDILIKQYIAEQTKFNKLLNRNQNTVVNIVEKFKIPIKTKLNNSKNLKLHPELIKYDKLYKSIDNLELLNKKDKLPLIGFGLNYINITKRPNINFDDNGKDIVMPMFSVSIPIFNKKYNSKTIQNKLQQNEIEFHKQEQLNKLETILSKAINDRISAEISYKTQTKNLNQVNKAIEILIKKYETDSIDFNDLLDVLELQLKFQINQTESIQKYYLQTAIINYLSS